MTLLDLTGLSSIDLGSVVKSSKVMGALGTVLSGVAAFLSNLFLIIMIMLFLLFEGPALMDRVRSAYPEIPPSSTASPLLATVSCASSDFGPTGERMQPLPDESDTLRVFE